MFQLRCSLCQLAIDPLQLFLGFDYSLLRAPFLEAARRTENPLRREDAVLICFGGADPNNETIRTLK